jgi:hypothetical protein
MLHVYAGTFYCVDMIIQILLVFRECTNFVID